MCPADSLVPKQLPTVKAIDYRAVTFLPLFRIKLTRNNHCEKGLSVDEDWLLGKACCTIIRGGEGRVERRA